MAVYVVLSTNWAAVTHLVHTSLRLSLRIVPQCNRTLKGASVLPVRYPLPPPPSFVHPPPIPPIEDPVWALPVQVTMSRQQFTWLYHVDYRIYSQ